VRQLRLFILAISGRDESVLCCAMDPDPAWQVISTSRTWLQLLYVGSSGVLRHLGQTQTSRSFGHGHMILVAVWSFEKSPSCSGTTKNCHCP